MTQKSENERKKEKKNHAMTTQEGMVTKILNFLLILNLNTHLIQ